MLNVMRDNLRHLKWVLWLVAISMVAYLGAFFSCDPGGAGGEGAPWAARVNGATISAERFRASARNLDAYYRQLFDTSYEQLKPQLQIGSQALESLIEQEMILQEARRLGIGASGREIAESIRSDPNFSDPTGQFIGDQRYMQLARRAFGSPEAYEKLVADQLVIDKWTNLIAQSVKVDDADLEEMHRQRTEKTALDYVVVKGSDQKVDDAFDGAELRAWYDAHPDDYMREEGRTIRYLVVDRETQTEQVEVTDTDVQSFYESNQANYSHPEQRRARHILLRSEPGADEAAKAELKQRADALLERLRAGEDFDGLARANSQDPQSAALGGDLGFFGRGDMVPAFENAAFDTPVGQLAPLTESGFGYHIIEVSGERQAGVLPLAEVEDAIRRTLRLRLAQERVASEAGRLRASVERSGIDEVAAEEGLTVEERFVARGDRLGDLGAAPEFADTVLALEAAEVSAPLRVASGLAVAVGGEMVPAAVKPFAEAEEAVRAALREARSIEVARRRALEGFGDGDDFDAAAKALGLEKQESGDLGPGQTLPGTGSSAQELAPHLFGADVEIDQVGLLDVPAGALLFSVARRETFDETAFLVAKPELRNEALQQRQNLWRQSVLERLREDQEIERNVELVARLNGS